jgi:predicted GNAT superfamily acetyltransferase
MILPGKIDIKRVENLPDIYKLIDVQQQIWGFDQLNITAPELIIVHAKLGGVVLGAFKDTGEMVGFVYSFPAEKDSEIIQWSHMLAVLPEYRRGGLGKRLKWRQREESLKKGMRLCCWTFDPLQTINCRFNIVGLGAVTGEYVVDAYGLRNGNFDAGLPTDRFIARWELNERRVLDCIDGRPQRVPVPADTLPIALALHDSQAFPTPSKPDTSIDDPCIAIAVPGGMNRLRKVDLEASLRWREATREVFTAYFKRGYYLTDILSPEESNSRAFLYILTRGLA